MQKTSFLLALSGTKQSLYAAEAAWALCQKSRAHLTAQHVADTWTAWELLRNDEPGLVGSGLYVNAFETLRNCQREIGKKLLEKYDSMANSKGIESDSVVDEGNPVDEICRRAHDHDLVIVGHRPYRNPEESKDEWHAIKCAVAEGLANKCTKPLLIVQDKVPGIWKSMRIVLSCDHINTAYVRACLRTALFLGVEPTITCLMTGENEESVSALRKDLHASHPDLAHVPIEAVKIEGMTAHDKLALMRGAIEDHPLAVDKDTFDTLVVLPTRHVEDGRRSVLDVGAEVFVRQLSAKALLLWPEEAVHPEGLRDQTAQQVSGATK